MHVCGVESTVHHHSTGNNAYREELRHLLTTLSPKVCLVPCACVPCACVCLVLAHHGAQERSAWILMERIKIPVRKNFLVRDAKAQFGKVVSELGIYGITISFVRVLVAGVVSFTVRRDGSQIVSSEVAGTLLRTKLVEYDDGGVAAGVAVLDSPFLVRADNEF